MYAFGLWHPRDPSGAARFHGIARHGAVGVAGPRGSERSPRGRGRACACARGRACCGIADADAGCCSGSGTVGVGEDQWRRRSAEQHGAATALHCSGAADAVRNAQFRAGTHQRLNRRRNAIE